MIEEIYKVHSLVRQVQTRTQRYKAPQHHKLVQKLAGGQVIVRRARPATITTSILMRHLDEFKKANEEGRIEVRTPAGGLVDLSTLKTNAPQPVVKPLPVTPVDSVAKDRTFAAGVGETRIGGVDEKLPIPSVSKFDVDDVAIETTELDPVEARRKERQQSEEE